MPRLTIDTRIATAKAATASGFRERIETLHSMQAMYANMFYEQFYAKDLPTICGLPDGWLPTDNDIGVSVDGEVIRLQFSGNFHQNLSKTGYGEFNDPNLKDVRCRFPKQDVGKTLDVLSTEDSLLARRILSWMRERDELRTKYREAFNLAQATIDKFTTSEKLVEAWPEIAPFIPKRVAPPMQLPAIQTADLNALLGLPVESVA